KRLWKKIDYVHLLDPIPTFEQYGKIARQRRRITRDIGNPWRPEFCERLRHGLSQAAPGRVHHHVVGFMTDLGEGYSALVPLREFRPAQVLFGRSTNRLSMRG